MKFDMISFGDASISIIDGDRGVCYPKKSDFQTSGHCLFLNTSNITKSGFNFSDLDFISEQKDAALRKGKLQRHDIVLTTRGTVGNSAYYGPLIPYDNLRINSGMVIFRTDQKLLDPYYLYLFLRSDIFSQQTKTHGSGSAQPQLPIGSLKNIKLPQPDLSTQKKIADVLSTLDAKIELNHRINQELEGLAKLLYDYWFVQFDFPISAEQAAAMGDPTLQGKPYRQSGGKMTYNPTLKREIPEGWEACTLDQALNLCYGKALKKEIQSPGPYPVYGSNGIYGYHKTPLVRGPGIIIGRKGTVGSVTWEHGDFFATDTSYYVETKSHYSMIYAFHLLKSLRLDLMNTDSAVPGLSRTYAYMRTFAAPDSGTIEAFTKVSMALRNLIHNNQKQNQELATLRDWLLPMLMNGQVRVGET